MKPHCTHSLRFNPDTEEKCALESSFHVTSRSLRRSVWRYRETVENWSQAYLATVKKAPWEPEVPDQVAGSMKPLLMQSRLANSH